uniref:HAUS augmin-like complex subunit 6 N-terminal domain-containing protein n=1 Tax=Lutzomyia longipalpis TaxID=7200 RepID=A0A1B0CUJ3_LUTLO
MAQGGLNAKDLRLEEEQRLSNCVYFGLYALTQAHKPTKEFEKVFQKDLFLKPNVAALPHVIHFLFTIHNPEEFRKRFYWPLYNDREAEKTFRTSCLKYLQDINEQFHLGMEDISTYMMLFPELKKSNNLELLNTMSISLGNRMLQHVSNQKDALDGLFTEKMRFNAKEQLKVTSALQSFQEKFQILASQRSVSKDDLLSEEYQAKEIAKTRERLEELNQLVDVMRQYNSSVEAHKAKVENLEKPLITNNLIQKTQEASEELLKQFPDIQERLCNGNLMINDKISAKFVLNLGNAILPQLITLLEEEWAKRKPSIDSNIETMQAVAVAINKISEDLTQRMNINAENLPCGATEAKNQLTNTPSYKFDTTLMVNCDNKTRLFFHDDAENSLLHRQMNQLHKLMYNSARSTKSTGSTTLSSIKTAKKHGNAKNEALSVMTITQKRSRPKKFTNYTRLGGLPGKWTEEAANFSMASSPGLDVSAQTSKFSIDGHLPLGSSSMI